ncbi:hypothetical protein DXM25_11360 [Agrobacterium rosae]|nr:hypothetical protein DXM25_11360 [Agrobacterium rosae]
MEGSPHICDAQVGARHVLDKFTGDGELRLEMVRRDCRFAFKTATEGCLGRAKFRMIPWRPLF